VHDLLTTCIAGRKQRGDEGSTRLSTFGGPEKAVYRVKEKSTRDVLAAMPEGLCIGSIVLIVVVGQAIMLC